MLNLNLIKMCEEIIVNIMNVFMVRHAFCYLDLQD